MRFSSAQASVRLRTCANFHVWRERPMCDVVLCPSWTSIRAATHTQGDGCMQSTLIGQVAAEDYGKSSCYWVVLVLPLGCPGIADVTVGRHRWQWCSLGAKPRFEAPWPWYCLLQNFVFVYKSLYRIEGKFELNFCVSYLCKAFNIEQNEFLCFFYFITKGIN